MTDTPGKKLQKDPEVVEKAARRRFTAEYKRAQSKIVAAEAP